ncbi:hypothetical protein ACJX0J_027567, partial [Zea mays]
KEEENTLQSPLQEQLYNHEDDIEEILCFLWTRQLEGKAGQLFYLIHHIISDKTQHFMQMVTTIEIHGIQTILPTTIIREEVALKGSHVYIGLSNS